MKLIKQATSNCEENDHIFLAWNQYHGSITLFHCVYTSCSTTVQGKWLVMRLTFPDQKAGDSSECLTWRTMEELRRQIWRQCKRFPGVSQLPRTRCAVSWTLARCKAIQMLDGGRSMLSMSWVPASTWSTCQSQKLGAHECLVQSPRSQGHSCTMAQ